MKTITKSLKWLLIIFLITAVVACKKKERDDAVETINKEEMKRKIAEIIPVQYQDTLTKLGISLNQETTPPMLEGAYAFKPLRLLKSNRTQDVANMSFVDGSVKFFAQDSENNIKLIGKSLLNSADTSLVTAISGNGNNFTVYGKVKSVRGSDSAIFGIIISGEKDGTQLRNIRYGLINIDNSKGGTTFIKQGEARVVFDTDQVSPSISVF